MATAARQRWRLLRSAVSRSAAGTELGAPPVTSTRYHPDRDLFDKEDVEAPGGTGDVRVRRYKSGSASFLVREIVPKADVQSTFDEYSGFLRTGNICIWPSEELMAFHLLSISSEFANKRVCELGAGMAGLAAFAVAATTSAAHVLLTEGNPVCVDNLAAMIELNAGTMRAAHMAARQLLWSEDFEWDDDRFDVVLLADCLYEQRLHGALLAVIRRILAAEGRALVMAPPRGGSLQAFAEAARDAGWTVDVREHYDAELTRRHGALLGTEAYNPDIHYPWLLTLARPEAM